MRRIFNAHALSCRPLTKEGFRRELRLRLCGRDERGNPPADETAVPSTVRQVEMHDSQCGIKPCMRLWLYPGAGACLHQGYQEIGRAAP